ncbi:sensor histidine kinase [Psychrosphaera aestuarii]|uniref:sensor histidine kinase n=1 Tax=Psychrosphaera aestuarii TaxID=1266052 RepID=UPI001B345070|nr:HAMP domain-containing sensor histidine kinase [Psychrosphaera aestuarii]
MKQYKRSISLKSAINRAILLVSIATLFISVSISTYVYKQRLEGESAYLAKTISEIVAYNSVVPISFDLRKGLNEFLSTLNNISEIANVHIYKIDASKEALKFFASYNKIGVLPVSTQIERLTYLNKARINNGYLEYAMAIKDPKIGDVIGHVYIRTRLTAYYDNLYDLLKINLLVIAFVALLAFLIAQSLRNRVLKPINNFVQELESASQDQEFKKKVSPIPFDEISVIADAVNELLIKIAQQIRRFSLAEQEITQLNQNLEEKVIFRTKALRESNEELLNALEQVHQYQSQVIQSEKMASLGQMVAGVAHEVNTPIGLGVTASTMLSDRIDDIKSKLDDKTLSAAQLASFLSDSRENTQIIYRNLTRAADLISSFKQVAVDQTAGVIREIKLHEYLDEIINSMQPTLKKYRHIVTINCDESLTIKTKPGPLNQIIINLIMNSITHGFKAMEQGQITINATLNKDKCIVNFIDNGCGIEEKIKQKVFDPFVTTSRGEGGSGLGLHLVYNLVTQALKGNISVVSELTSGAQFTIEFPAYLQENSHD